MNILHRFLGALLVSLLALSTVLAQGGNDNRDARLAAFRAEVFTRVLQLTPEEAQQFWPIYNEFSDKREQIQQDQKPEKRFELMSDTEVEEQIRRHFERKQRELDLERESYQKLRKVLPLRKVAQLPMAEREFRESLVKKLQEARERRQERQQVRPGNRN